MSPTNMVLKSRKISDFEDKSLLIVDDDTPFRDRLSRAMEKKGFIVSQAQGVQAGIKRVIYIEKYRDTEALDFLKKVGVICEQLI